MIRETDVPVAEALGLVTTGPAKNMGLSRKGRIAEGCDADFCWFDENWNLIGVAGRGKVLMDADGLRTHGHF
jgi:beta-aspartyl-dipeptidase (metallo-type)